MSTKPYWINGPWLGRLAISARPRGGDWLEDEVTGWHKSGIDIVLSLLTPDEEKNLEVLDEAESAKSRGINFLSLPIPDREVPISQTEVAAAIEKLNINLSTGKNVLIHCRQGVGRSGLVAACLLITKGYDPSRAMDHVSAARGVAVPETLEQRRWIEHYAASLAGAK